MTALNHATNDAMVDRHFRCEMGDDLEGVLTTMTADVAHDTVVRSTPCHYLITPINHRNDLPAPG